MAPNRDHARRSLLTHSNYDRVQHATRVGRSAAHSRAVREAARAWIDGARGEQRHSIDEHVVVNYVRSAGTAHTMMEAVCAHGGHAVTVQADVSKVSRVTAFFDVAKQ